MLLGLEGLVGVVFIAVGVVFILGEGLGSGRYGGVLGGRGVKSGFVGVLGEI